MRSVSRESAAGPRLNRPMSPTDNKAHLLYSLGLNGAAAVSFRNRLINGAFSVNQRAASDGPTVYEPGEFVRDRWRAGPGGCTAACKMANNGDATIHIGAGSLLQVIEGRIYLPETGTYCLSWQGTALGRVLAPDRPAAFTSGPIMTTLSAGSDAAVEFSLSEGGSPVSLGLAQLEPGSTPTVFERRDDELWRCRRYFQLLADPPLRGVIQAEGLAGRCAVPLSPSMRARPTVKLSGSLYIFDGTTSSSATSIASDYSTAEYLDIDLHTSSALAIGRPAIIWSAGQGGNVELDAEL